MNGANLLRYKNDSNCLSTADIPTNDLRVSDID